jgi:hypothetical protein
MTMDGKLQQQDRWDSNRKKALDFVKNMSENPDPLTIFSRSGPSSSCPKELCLKMGLMHLALPVIMQGV